VSELQEDRVAENLLAKQSEEESEKALTKCVELLGRTVKSRNIPMPSYVKVSSAISHSLFDQC
jgi:hypothetical protein